MVISVGDAIRLYELTSTFTKQIFAKFEADDWVKLANRYYQKEIDDLALICLDRAIETNKSDNEKCSQLYIIKGDIFTHRGMYLFQNEIDCLNSFEESIKEFRNSIQIDPFNSVAWLGKGFSQLMLALQFEEEPKIRYHTYEAIFSIEAGLGALEGSKHNKNLESNLWDLKGAAYYLIDMNEEGDKCFERANID